uniref:Reverse transcriptase Ty1/copia-type domain-containing protein n=1 Tax=Peronospora matthiolae TaxID=2874970 RepID=A0AAV1UGC0_9STRA
MEVSEETLKTIRATNKKEVVLELHKSLYGLKQAGRLWIQLSHARLLDAGFSQCQSDMCLFWKVDDGQLVVVGVYVSYLLATRTDKAAVEHFFNQLRSLSPRTSASSSNFLKMRVAMEDDGSYILEQTEAIGELLCMHGLENTNATQSSIGLNCYKVQLEDCELLGESADSGGPSVRTFQSLVGSLLWVARWMRPDIAFAVHQATRQSHQPRLHELKLAKRIARYLKFVRKFKLRMKLAKISYGELQHESLSDADFAADKSYRKSLTVGSLA